MITFDAYWRMRSVVILIVKSWLPYKLNKDKRLMKT